MIDALTLQQLACFDAVAAAGSFQAAADRLGRSHPAVFAAVRALEAGLGLALLDRSGYRVRLTDAGRSVHERARVLLAEATALRTLASQLAMGAETDLSVVIGDLCPVPDCLRLLQGFFATVPATRLHLQAEAISGPWERLLDGEADLILHHIDKADPRLEYVDLGHVRVVPVVAPGFLPGPPPDDLAPEHLRDRVQCVIRDTARRLPPRDYYLVEGGRRWTVGDQMTKKQIVLQGMGWGHLPDFLIADELASGTLLALTGPHFRGGGVELVAARLRQRPHGPVAQQLWRHLGAHGMLDAHHRAAP